MRVLFIGLVAALFTVQAAQAVIVFDNTANSLNTNMPLLPEWRNDSAEAGDDIWLAGTEREIVQMKIIFSYRGTLPGTMDLQLRFRDVDEFEQTPSSVFYDTGIMQGIQVVAGLSEYVFDIPHVIVPDHFVWTVQAYNRQGTVGELGPAYYNPASVGFSDDFFWLSDGGSPWTNYSWGGDPYANFAAQLVAVPEPGTMAALAGGAALLLRRRRSKK